MKKYIQTQLKNISQVSGFPQNVTLYGMVYYIHKNT